MRLRVGVDMDGTLILNDNVWAQYFNQHAEEHGHPYQMTNYVPTWSYFPDCCKNCFHECVNNPDILAQSELIPGVLEGLQELSTFASLWLISHRPPELTNTALGLLFKYQIFEYFVGCDWSWGDKRVACETLDINALIDDGPKNIVGLNGSTVTPIVYDQPYNRYLDASYRRATDWKEVVHLCRIMNKEREGLGT